MTRQRFTIAHEIGHALLHARDDAALFTGESRVHLRDSGEPLNDIEIEANRFAAELLMPENEVRKLVVQPIEIYEEVVVGPLAREFNISSQAFTARLVELGLVLKTMYKRGSAIRSRH
jgi:Zn-dependent peptidase ImmA (M78 family)